MTDEELRKLDAQIHREVMGQDCVELWLNDKLHTIPRYSTDIAASWQVVEKLVSSGYLFIVKGDGLRSGDHNPKWTVLCDNMPRVDADAAPLAICLAAIKAIRAGKQQGVMP